MGIFDADIHGPSIPTLLQKERAILESPVDEPNMILPIEYEGVKVRSEYNNRRCHMDMLVGNRKQS